MNAPGATLDEMRNVAAREAERLAIWETADGRARRDREAYEGLVRICDALLANPGLMKQLAAEVRKVTG